MPASHEHVWAPFAGGEGCRQCTAWRFRTAPVLLIDATPTGLIERPAPPIYAPAVGDDDLVLETMNDLLGIARPDVAWGELEALSIRLIHRIRQL